MHGDGPPGGVPAGLPAGGRRLALLRGRPGRPDDHRGRPDGVYGADEPTYTASVVGLANGDTKADLGDLTFAGAPPDAGVGSYVITVSGATNPNYDITYATGTEKVTPARLTITADDTTRVYGEDPSAYTASYDGFVNGDDQGAVDRSPRSPAARPPGPMSASTPSTVVGCDEPQLRHRPSSTGTEKVTPARLTITADDKIRVYGEDAPAYTASYDGFVNGDDQGEVTGLEITGGAPAGADVGDYPIHVAGAVSPNYAIAYVAGTEHVTPAPLTITADDQSRVYGAKVPAYTASYDGLVNGDTQAQFTDLTLTGPPTGQGSAPTRSRRPAPATPTTRSTTPRARRPSRRPR